MSRIVVGFDDLSTTDPNLREVIGILPREAQEACLSNDRSPTRSESSLPQRVHIRGNPASPPRVVPRFWCHRKETADPKRVLSHARVLEGRGV